MVSLVCSDISAEAWNVLTSLPTDPDRDQCVINKSITLNGFNVSRTSPDLYSIIAAANVIPGYGGAEDLVQILTHISRDDNSCHVHRPGKVLHYLKVCICIIRLLCSTLPLLRQTCCQGYQSLLVNTNGYLRGSGIYLRLRGSGGSPSS